MELLVFYFTFGIGAELESYFQQVIAKNMQEAEKKMFDVWGKNFAFGYTSEEFEKEVREGRFMSLKALPTIYAEKHTMTIGEMNAWTRRLTNVLLAEEEQRESRLQSLKRDVELATNYKSDYFAAALHNTVVKAMRSTA